MPQKKRTTKRESSLPSSRCSLSRIALDPDFDHHACRKSSTNTSTMDRAVVLPSRSRSMRLQTVVSFGLWVYPADLRLSLRSSCHSLPASGSP